MPPPAAPPVGLNPAQLQAVHHLDGQFARVIDHLRQRNLLDSTIVILVGDHGEEFMEHGFWGHNSTFSDPQTRTRSRAPRTRA